jgi:hypothetical protein
VGTICVWPETGQKGRGPTMNSIEQILEDARMRILSRQIHNHDTLAAFFPVRGR